MKKKALFYWILQQMLRWPILQKVRIVFWFFDSLMLHFMREPPKDRERKKRVMLVFPFALGDCILFMGTADYMKTLYPKTHYRRTVTCQKEYAALFLREFEDVLPLDYRRASVNPFYRIYMLWRLRKEYYDLAIDPIGTEECSPNVFAMHVISAGKKIGVLSVSDKIWQCPSWIREHIYDEIIYNPAKNLHRTEFYAWFWSELGNCSFRPKLARLSVKCSLKLPKRYFVVFPSASSPVKRWPAENFAGIAGRIFKRTGWPLVLCGTQTDLDAVEKMKRRLPAGMPVIDYISQTSVMDFIGLINGAELVLTNDTSAYHIAVAGGRKTCIVTGGYVYETFIRYPRTGYGCQEPVIVYRRRSCENCNNHCRQQSGAVYPCVLDNSVQEVWDGVLQLLLGGE